MNKWIANNFWLKAISLVLAVITWFYIYGELTKRQANYYPRPPIIPRP